MEHVSCERPEKRRRPTEPSSAPIARPTDRAGELGVTAPTLSVSSELVWRALHRRPSLRRAHEFPKPSRHLRSPRTAALPSRYTDPRSYSNFTLFSIFPRRFAV